jgi:hypothetical protein
MNGNEVAQLVRDRLVNLQVWQENLPCALSRDSLHGKLLAPRIGREKHQTPFIEGRRASFVGLDSVRGERMSRKLRKGAESSPINVRSALTRAARNHAATPHESE